MKNALCSAVILLLLLASYLTPVYAMTSESYQIPTIVSGGDGGTSGSGYNNVCPCYKCK